MRARTGGYVVDMVIFCALAMVVVVIAGFVLLAATDWAQGDPSNADIYAFLATIGIGTPVLWSALNLVVLSARAQTGGQYVAGLRLAREDGTRPTSRSLAGWWFCLNPLLFSWPMGLVAGLCFIGAISIISERSTVWLAAVVFGLCLLMPLVSLVAAVVDPLNRTLHDRVAGVVAVPAE